MGNFAPRVRRNLEVVPCGYSRRLPRAGFMSPSQSAMSKWGWGFHTVRSGIDQEDLRFCPRVVGFVDVWKDF